MGPHLRSGNCPKAAGETAEAAQPMAPGRDVRSCRWQADVPVAGYRCRRRGPGRAPPGQARREGCSQTHAQAAEAAGHGTGRVGHRQEPGLRRCPSYAQANQSISYPAQASEQQSRKFARSGTTARAEATRVQIARSAQRFLSLHAATYNLFTLPRHLVSALTHRLFRAEAFEAWRNAAGVAA
jgi:hypothetical protein